MKIHLFLFLLTFLFLAPLFVLAVSQQVIVSGTVPGCGDGIIQSGESCDSFNLNNQTCLTLGYSGGILSCNSNCTFNTSQCSLGGGGGGGGGAGGTYSFPSGGSVVFSGRAYPGSEVTLLKDAQVVSTTIAGPDATFFISVSGVSSGNYIFSLYAEDKDGVRSSLLSFPVSVTAGAVNQISGIFIAPTIAIDKTEVKRGDAIKIFGQTSPNSKVVIHLNSEEEIFKNVEADKNGVYLLNFDTSLLDFGQHSAKSKASLANQISPFSKVVNFLVGTKNVLSLKEKSILKGDLNNDGRVNLVDFSIAAYWYKRNLTLSSDFLVKEREGLNGDSKIDLIDFSIMAFYWTG